MANGPQAAEAPSVASGAGVTSSVRVEDDGPVRIVTLDRPAARNAIDPATADELLRVFQAFELDASARVAVLCGEGGHFCAGADLKAFTTGQTYYIAPDGPGPLGPTRLDLGKPVIAAVSGYAVAGGLELALWCDLRIADETAVFGVFCRRWGVPLIDGGTLRLPRIVGRGRALDLILTGRAVDATEALQMGLANRLVPAGQARTAAVALAHELAALPQACLLADRRSALDNEDTTAAEAFAREIRNAAGVFGEAQRGAARFAAGAGRHGGPAEES